MENNLKIKIILADDHNYTREILALYLRNNYSHTIDVIAEAANGIEVLELVKINEPDIVLLDLDMPVLHGHDTLKILTQKYPKISVIILSQHFSEFYASLLILDGACAYLKKDCFFKDILYTIEKVYTDGFYFDDLISKQVKKALLKEKKTYYLITQNKLSERELEVFQQMCENREAKEIADQLNISEHTVNYHKKSIYRKTNCDSIVSLVKYAIKQGITRLN